MKTEFEGGLQEIDASTKEMETRLTAVAARSDELKESLDKLFSSAAQSLRGGRRHAGRARHGEHREHGSYRRTCSASPRQGSIF